MNHFPAGRSRRQAGDAQICGAISMWPCESTRRTPVMGRVRPTVAVQREARDTQFASGNSRPVTDIRERPLSSRLYHPARLFWASYASWTNLLYVGGCFSCTRCPSELR